MSSLSHHSSATQTWRTTLSFVFHDGHEIRPRDRLTRELLHHAVRVNMNRPLVSVRARKLSQRFAAAEALWVLAGDTRVEPLARFAPRMREFSDDGVHLAGAYGPRIREQLDYVVRALLKDRDTRQAVLTIWKPNPPPSKDIPCTVALAFQIRFGRLHCHAFMRSSDVWLGLPYDVFTFSMVAAHVACAHNAAIPAPEPVELGTLFLTAASSHLYEENFEAVDRCLGSEHDDGPLVPSHHVLDGSWGAIQESLIAMRDGAAP